jgi:peroxidase
MHDVSYSQDSLEVIEIPMPLDEQEYPLNTTFQVRRSTADPATGTSKRNPRQVLNQATTWFDLSALYGSSEQVALSLRSFQNGKLLAQKSDKKADTGEYLPFNLMGSPMNTRPGVNLSELFLGGDARTNEDWILLAVHTLFLREHNRLCDILLKQHPEYNDEQTYQTVRLIMSAKYALIANSYQMTYWNDDMPWPRHDG